VRLLVLGGTVFVGRAVVEAALERGHAVTLFHRGSTGAELFPEVERVLGDRDGGVGVLAEREFDAVVDTSGYVPRVVAQACEALAGVGRYCFVSSVSAYDDETATFDEETGRTWGDPGSEDVSRYYGELKAACERVVDAAFGERAFVVRPGLIVGPHDPTDRFTYWMRRYDRGGDVLAPAPPGRLVQVIDVRDLGAWLVRGLEDGLSGTFNACGDPLPFTDVVEAAAAAAANGSRTVWVDEQLLLDEGVGPWLELPLWLPSSERSFFGETPNEKAKAAGLSLRPLAETVGATLEWARTTPVVGGSRVVGPSGLAPDREAELLAKAAAA
jgi:2'-hydroxyisoflavone reductase